MLLHTLHLILEYYVFLTMYYYLELCCDGIMENSLDGTSSRDFVGECSLDDKAHQALIMDQ